MNDDDLAPAISVSQRLYETRRSTAESLHIDVGWTNNARLENVRDLLDDAERTIDSLIERIRRLEAASGEGVQ
jgi:hypothetical protein